MMLILFAGLPSKPGDVVAAAQVDDERFTAAYLAALRSLHERGAAATVAALVRG